MYKVDNLNKKGKCEDKNAKLKYVHKFSIDYIRI